MKYNKLNKEQKREVLHYLTDQALKRNPIIWNTEFEQYLVCIAGVKRNLARDAEFCERLINMVESGCDKKHLTEEIKYSTMQAIEDNLEELNFLPQDYEKYITTVIV